MSQHALIAALVSIFVVFALSASVGLDPDADRDFCGIVTAKGYPCEVHYVTTGDGYILTIFRIPGSKGSKMILAGKPTALLFHGLIDNSFTWIVNYPGQSLSYMLADAGFDVWMGNARGNRYALNNTHLKPTEAAFWAFSWDQQVTYDLPNTVDYILGVTGNKKLSYCGHSQGTTQAFAAFSSNPALAKKISSFAALAPVMEVGHLSNTMLQLLADIDPALLLKLLGVHQFLGPNAMPFPINKAIELLCHTEPTICETVIEIWVGPTNAPQNSSRLEVIATHEPGGTSTQNMIHWLQMYRSGEFQMFDYGTQGNQKNYGQPTPPMYNISVFPKSIPSAFYIGGRDELADPTDVAALIAAFPQKPLVVSIPEYGHLDFVWALDANTRVYDSVVSFFQKNV